MGKQHQQHRGFWVEKAGWLLLVMFVMLQHIHMVSTQAPDPSVFPSDNTPNTDGIPASPQEVLALLRIKHTLVDPTNALASWNESGVGACSGTWIGIKCAQGRIIAIALPAKGLSGSLATDIGQLVGLRKLNVHDNAITGALPSALATIKTLRGLALFNNKFTGSVPTGFGSLPLLQALDASNNDLSGVLPADLGNAPNLTLLNLSKNNISGSMPSGYGGFQGTYFNLASNNLSGALPDSWTAPNLQQMYVNNNGFSGSLPGSLGKVLTLQVLDVAHNDISGTIPSSYANLTSLNTLLLNQNNLSGPFPPAFTDLKLLKSLNVSYNNLSGAVPAFATAFNLSSFQPGNTGLCGYAGLLACPPAAPSPSPAPTSEIAPAHAKKGLTTLSIVFIALGSALAAILLAVMCIIIFCRCCRGGKAAAGTGGKPERSPEREGDVGGKLVHFEGPLQFSADDLLCATAEVLGKSTYGTVYKATLENGNHIAVKRLREGIVKSQKEFTKEVDVLGKIRHPNLLALRAYYWGPKDEKLLVYDYMSGGSLAAFLHGE